MELLVQGFALGLVSVLLLAAAYLFWGSDD
jgi:hypothetical protein